MAFDWLCCSGWLSWIRMLMRGILLELPLGCQRTFTALCVRQIQVPWQMAFDWVEIVANTQMRTLRTEVGKGSLRTAVR